METHQIRILWEVGSWAGCVLVSSWIPNAWEIFAARPWPSLCKIRKFSPISWFEHESQKKVSSLPRPRPWFRPRFSDLSLHLQLWRTPTTSGAQNKSSCIVLCKNIVTNKKFNTCKAYKIIVVLTNSNNIFKNKILHTPSKYVASYCKAFGKLFWYTVQYMHYRIHSRTYVRAENKRVSISQTDELLGSKRYCNVVFDSPILSENEIKLTWDHWCRNSLGFDISTLRHSGNRGR